MFYEFLDDAAPAFQEAEHAIVMYSKGRVSAVFCVAPGGSGYMDMHSSLHPDAIRAAMAILLLGAASCCTDELPKAKVLALQALLKVAYTKEREVAEDNDLPF